MMLFNSDQLPQELYLEDVMSKEDYDDLIKQLVFERAAFEDLEEKMERSFRRKPRSYKEELI